MGPKAGLGHCDEENETQAPARNQTLTSGSVQPVAILTALSQSHRVRFIPAAVDVNTEVRRVLKGGNLKLKCMVSQLSCIVASCCTRLTFNIK
jgi:hypothetical protein